MKFVSVSDLIESNGKTVRENNLAKSHTFPLGTLVEIIPWDDDCEFGGVRLYITRQTRDCDGTPLYSLGVPGKDYEHGIGEGNLQLVKELK